MRRDLVNLLEELADEARLRRRRMKSPGERRAAAILERFFSRLLGRKREKAAAETTFTK